MLKRGLSLWGCLVWGTALASNAQTATPTVTYVLTPPCGTVITLGNPVTTGVGATSDYTPGLRACAFPLSGGAMVYSIAVYAEPSDAGGLMSAAIYSGVPGIIGGLLIQSPSQTLTSGWNLFPLPPTYLGPSYYYLAYMFANTYRVTFQTGSTNQLAYTAADVTYGAFPAIFSAPVSYGNVEDAIYLNYCPATVTPTNSPTVTDTGTPTLSPTATWTCTVTSTPAISPTPTPSLTGTVSSTETATPSTTATETPTDTVAFTSTWTSSPTLTPTIAVSTNTPTSSPTVTQTVTNTASFTPTSTLSPTTTATDTVSTATPTPSPMVTQTFSDTPVFTFTWTLSPTETPSTTETLTPTDTPTPSFTVGFSPTGTPTPTGTDTPTASSTGTPTQTLTPTPIPAATLTPTFTATSTPAPSLAAPVLFPNPLREGNGLSVQMDFTEPHDYVAIKVYTTAFRKIYERDFKYVPAGFFTFSFDNFPGSAVANGLYYVAVSTPSNRWIDKLLILR